MSFQTHTTFVQHARVFAERNQRCLRSVDSAYAERKQRSLRWLHSGVLSKIAEDGNSGEELLNKLCYYWFFLHTKIILVAS